MFSQRGTCFFSEMYRRSLGEIQMFSKRDTYCVLSQRDSYILYGRYRCSFREINMFLKRSNFRCSRGAFQMFSRDGKHVLFQRYRCLFENNCIQVPSDWHRCTPKKVQNSNHKVQHTVQCTVHVLPYHFIQYNRITIFIIIITSTKTFLTILIQILINILIKCL